MVPPTGLGPVHSFLQNTGTARVPVRHISNGRRCADGESHREHFTALRLEKVYPWGDGQDPAGPTEGAGAPMRTKLPRTITSMLPDSLCVRSTLSLTAETTVTSQGCGGAPDVSGSRSILAAQWGGHPPSARQPSHRLHGATLMFDGKHEFGNAWLAAFASHGHDNSNAAFAFTPAAIKGSFYNSMYERWNSGHRETKETASQYLERHWEEIERTCYGPRQEAGPIKGDEALIIFHQMLEKDQASALVGLGLEHQPALQNAFQYIVSHAPRHQRDSFRATIARAQALESELARMIEAEPLLSHPFESQTSEAVRLLGEMLTYLINNQVGAFARLGEEKELGWAVLPDRLEQLKELSPAERQRMSGCCAYIRQMAFLPTTMSELLTAEP